MEDKLEELDSGKNKETLHRADSLEESRKSAGIMLEGIKPTGERFPKKKEDNSMNQTQKNRKQEDEEELQTEENRREAKETEESKELKEHRRRQNVDNAEQQCSNCGTTRTPLWRRAPDGTLICNACGLYLKSNHSHRPVNLKRPPNTIPLVQDGKGSCKGDGRCNGTGGTAGCSGCPAYNNRLALKREQARRDNGHGSDSAEDPVEDPFAIACYNCESTITPLWRRDDEGNTVCNACGLYYKLHGSHRPTKLKRATIKRRKRNISGSKKLLHDDKRRDNSPVAESTKMKPQLKSEAGTQIPSLDSGLISGYQQIPMQPSSLQVPPYTSYYPPYSGGRLPNGPGPVPGPPPTFPFYGQQMPPTFKAPPPVFQSNGYVYPGPHPMVHPVPSEMIKMEGYSQPSLQFPPLHISHIPKRPGPSFSVDRTGKMPDRIGSNASNLVGSPEPLTMLGLQTRNPTPIQANSANLVRRRNESETSPSRTASPGFTKGGREKVHNLLYRPPDSGSKRETSKVYAVDYTTVRKSDNTFKKEKGLDASKKDMVEHSKIKEHLPMMSIGGLLNGDT